jgi:hypothetical protein
VLETLETIDTINKISDFVFGDGLEVTMSTIIGDNEMDAAKSVLANIAHARDKGAEMHSVLTHLQSSHIAYFHTWEQKGWSGLVNGGTSYGEWLISLYKDLYVCSIMAICYASIGEYERAMDSLSLADKAHDAFYNYLSVTSAPRRILQSYIRDITILNPKQYFYNFKIFFFKAPLPIDVYPRFRDNVKKALSVAINSEQNP